MEVHVNYLAVAAAAIACYIIAAIWYGVIFSKLWQRLTGITDMKPAPLNIVLVLISSFVMAFVLDHSIIFADTYHKVSGMEGGITVAIFIWLGFVATVTLCTKLYEKKPWGLWVLDNAFWLISLLVMGSILSVWT
jgi:hypothetical protein